MEAHRNTAEVEAGGLRAPGQTGLCGDSKPA